MMLLVHFALAHVVVFGSLSGVLSELDSALGPLSLNSSMVSLVRYTRQGLHWLRLDTRGTQ